LQLLLAVAQREFLAMGFRDTGLESIARKAGVSKKTVYHHFGSKARLFLKIFEALRETWIVELSDIVLASHPPAYVLNAVALHLLDVGTRPEMVGLHRLFLNEAQRFPGLVSDNYGEHGTARGMEPLSAYLREAVDAGALRLDDIPLATEQFVQLVLGGIRIRLLLGVAKRPGLVERRRIARQAVDIFLSGCADPHLDVRRPKSQ
jgi:TetR/AcrR family transcriptional regulator, mexJK operon transcriptional repressor